MILSEFYLKKSRLPHEGFFKIIVTPYSLFWHLKLVSSPSLPHRSVYLILISYCIITSSCDAISWLAVTCETSVSPFHPHYSSYQIYVNLRIMSWDDLGAAALLPHVVLWQKGDEGYGRVQVVDRTPKFPKRIRPSDAMWLTIYAAEHGARDIGELHALRRYVVMPS